jgi:hypothetical protein
MEDGSEAGCDLPPGQPSQSCELPINSEKLNRQIGQNEVTVELEQSVEKKNLGLIDNDNNVNADGNDVNEVWNEKDLPGNDKDLLKLMWKAMQEDKREREKDRKEDKAE